MNTRQQIIRLLRRSNRTVSELADELEVTSNAVRSHLAILERDGLVHPVRMERETRGRPARVYGLTAKAEDELSGASRVVLDGLLDVLHQEVGPDLTELLLRRTGRRLGREVPAGNGSLRHRVDRVMELLGELGGLAEVEGTDTGYRIKGHGCPFASFLPEHPEICTLAEELVATVTGAPVRQRCDPGGNGGRASCEFEIGGRHGRT